MAQAGVVNPILTEIPEFETGVDAAVLEGHVIVQGVLVSAIALYALKGPTFLAISEVTIGGNPATQRRNADPGAYLTREDFVPEIDGG